MCCLVSSSSAIASLFFFFHRSAPHRYLHSFPTRRSSDLDSIAVDIARMIDHDAAGELWDRYKRGERNVFTRKLYRSEEHTSELQSRVDLVCRLLLEKKKPISSPIRWPSTPATPCPSTTKP